MKIVVHFCYRKHKNVSMLTVINICMSYRIFKGSLVKLFFHRFGMKPIIATDMSFHE